MDIAFERPWVLLLIPVVIGLLIFSMRYMVTRRTTTKISQIIVRGILALALIFALAQVSVKMVGNSVTTIFLVDVSDSVREQREEVIKFVNQAVETKGRRDYVGIIAFGKDTRVEQFISQNISFAELQTDVTTEATDLEEAVNLALAEMPEDSAKRIVLITDGNENEGSLKDTALTVVDAGCEFAVKKLSENEANEVYVSDISVPQEVGTGENFNINVSVESNVACQAVVSLYSGRTLKGQQSVTLQKGTNHYVFRDTQSDEGLKTYRVTVDAQADTVTVNNEFSAYTNIEIEAPILIVEGVQGNGDELCRIFDSLGQSYDCVVPATVPSTMSDFTEYSAVVFVDVYADDLRKGFMENLENYVKNYGGGFIVTGGENSYALGNYRDSAIEKVLPVNMELQGEDEIPGMALQLVIDQSGSMSDGNGFITNLDLAKEAANAALGNVREADYIGVMSFDDNYDRVVPLQKAEDKDAISDAIFSIGIDGGTSIYPALLAATQDVNECDAMIKHIILLTDGQDSYGEYEELKKAINQGAITLSTVAVGQGCNETLLKDLAESCGGRYYYTDINSDIPRIFAQEVFLSSNTYLINEEFTPIVTSADRIIAGVTTEGLPNLYGYVATSPKERSIQVLQTPYGDPLLSYWQYGLGKTVAWTSDMTGEWSGQYAGWENTQLLWHNIIEYVTQDMAMEGTYTEVVQNGTEATLQYFTDSFDGNTSVWATVFDDTGASYEIELEPTKPGEYEADITTDSTGIYTINVQQRDGEEVVSSINTAAIMQYSMEYRFYPNNTLLEEYVASVGGRMLTEAVEVFSTEPEYVKTRWNLSTFLLVFAACLFLLDIAIRRFHLDWAQIFTPSEKALAKQAARKAAKEEKKALAMEAAVKEAAAKAEKKTTAAVLNENLERPKVVNPKPVTRTQGGMSNPAQGRAGTPNGAPMSQPGTTASRNGEMPGSGKTQPGTPVTRTYVKPQQGPGSGSNGAIPGATPVTRTYVNPNRTPVQPGPAQQKAGQPRTAQPGAGQPRPAQPRSGQPGTPSGVTQSAAPKTRVWRKGDDVGKNGNMLDTKSLLKGLEERK